MIRRAALRTAGLAAGLGIAVAVIPALRPAPGPLPMPLTVDVSVSRSGEVGLVGSGQAVVGGEIVRGSGTDGALDIVSQTAVPVALTVQDVGKPAGFEERVWVHITVDDAVVFDGTRALLRHGPSSAVLLKPTQVARLAVTVSLPPTGPDEFQGRRLELALLLSSAAAPAEAHA